MSINAPFLRIGARSSGMAVWTMGALLVPTTLYSLLYHSTFIFHLVGYTLLGMLAESVYTLLVKRKARFSGISSGLTAALLAASVPTSIPFLPMCYAILIAVWIVKLPMVGLPLRFNAAMVGRLFLMLVYPAHVVNWGTPTADVISTATPQELYRSEGFALEWQQAILLHDFRRDDDMLCVTTDVAV
jgi:Na+-translocating ferredoxin:NAD+ oxidoreductase RnfD subunit